MTRFVRWTREPLVHFVVLGMAVLGLYRWVASPTASKRIVLSQSVINGLRQDHLRRTGAWPTDEEERSLIGQFIDNEVLYREALALGLDRGDIIVRRRLVQKMEFLTEAEEVIPDPTDTELEAYLAAHAEHYVIPDRLTLTQVFIGADRHETEAARLAGDVRDQLLAGDDPGALGDPFLHGRDFNLRSERELGEIFGDAFAAQVMTLPVGTWSRPLRSSYGWHLVRVSEHVSGRVPALAEIRTAVARQWHAERQRDATRLALDRLRGQYAVHVEPPTQALARR